jgi:protein SCO1/2
MPYRRFAVALLVLLAALTAGCGREEAKFRLTDVSGVDFGKALDLTGHDGRARTLADFRGKVIVVFFGFTHCPDVCPATLAELAEVAKALGKDAARMQVLFVTLDPARDTPQALAKYVTAFDPSFLGLYGDAAATARAAREFKIYYRKQPLAGANYTIDHSAGMYILDKHGRLRLFAQHGTDPATLRHDIRLLIEAP